MFSSLKRRCDPRSKNNKEMARKKGIFVAMLLLSCLGMFFITLQNVDLCYFCFSDYIPYNLSYDRKMFMKLPDVDCRQTPPFLVLLVTTTHEQNFARMAVRQTWGKKRSIRGKKVITYFLLGAKQSRKDEDRLTDESIVYNDIIQRDFIDSYSNLTLKTLLGIDWITQHCPQASYVMKTDTDMFVNIFYLVELLLRKNQTSNLFTGFLKPDDRPIRSIFSKWYVSKKEYTGWKYPPFCSGTGYVFSVDVALKIYNISATVQFLKLEDVYIGMCLDRLKIPLQELHTEPTFFPSKPSFSVCTYRKIVTSHEVQPQEILLYWEALRNSKDEHC
ncbi:beta-1,3-galactosyltransferase 5-like [Mixophyes fleayi]|uniref:beta-1,3-galactosyltransferase 5-like n=1 Tax=Mixophyes fleayi TaxID=3061075 RepID=UPI003F4D8D89